MKRLILFAAVTLAAAPGPRQQPSSTTGAQPATMTVVLRPDGMVMAMPDPPPAGGPQVTTSVTVSPSTMVVLRKDGTLAPVQATPAADIATVQPSGRTKVDTNPDGSTTETTMDGSGKPIVTVVRRAAGTPPGAPK
jgi:hypothetical protein